MAATDIDNPRFVRLWLRLRPGADARGERDHRRRLLDGLAGRVVELGPGDGANFALYPGEVTEVVAVEPEPRFRTLAEAAAASAPVPVRVVAGTAEDLPVADGSADAVVASLVLCSVADVAATLDEARRVLRPGGELRFYEHVHAERQPLRAVLEVLDRTRVWPALGGGCHPTRDAVASIRAAGLELGPWERFGFAPSRLAPAIPHVLGVARRT